MRFMELLADALIGDIKNNITMSSSGGVRLIQGRLTESQIPELVKAGIDVIIEQSGNRYYDWNESVVGGEYIWEQITIGSDGMKTVNVYKQKARPMSADEEKAWNNGTYYDVYGSDDYGISYIDDIYYILLSSRELAESYTAPATLDDIAEIRDFWYMPMKSLAINYLHGEAEVDANGDMLSFKADAKLTIVNIFGDTNVIELNAGMNFTDIGTSEAVCPIPGAEQLLTKNYMQNNFGSYYGYVYFTLNEDGSINASSVTTTYPGENDLKTNYGRG
jgi:hypothetical protein